MTANIGSLVADLRLETSAFTANIKKASADLNSNVARMKRATNDLEKSFKSLNQSASMLQTGLKGLAGAAVTGMAVKALQMADAYNVLQARLKQATKDTGDYAGVSKNLQAVAIATGTTLEDNVGVFQRLALGAKDLGKSNQDVLKLLKIVDQLGSIGGSGPEAMKAGLLQFGQAMSSGIVRAEEFNSIVENLPELANRIAKGLGVSTGQLRQMVISGKLLSTQVFDALLKQSDSINKDFQQMPSTMARGWNGFMEVINSSLGAFDQGGGFTKSIGAGFNTLSQTLQDNRNDILAFGAFVAKTLQTISSGFMTFLNAFGGTVNTIADLVMRMIETIVNGTLDDINKAIDRLNKMVPLAIPSIPVDHSHNNAFSDEAKKYWDSMNQEAGKFSKNWGDLMQGDFTPASTKSNDQVSDKHGKPAPIIDKNAAANAKKVAEFVKDLNLETQAVNRLLAAKKQSDEAYEQTKLKIEAENEVLKKNLKLTDTQKKNFIAQAYANKINQKTTDFVGVRRELQQQIKDNMNLAKARLKGHDALLKEQDKQAVEAFVKTQGAGMKAAQVDNLRIYKARELATERAKAFTDTKAQLQDELSNSEKLVDAQKLGTVEFTKQQALLEATNQAKQMGLNFTDAQIKQLAELNTQIAQNAKAQALLAENQGLQQEISDTQRLTTARLAGIKSYEQMAIAISAENTVRQAGIELLSAEGQTLYQSAYNAQLAQYNFQKLQDQMDKFAQIGQQVGDIISGSFEQMIVQGGKFSDVLKQLGLDMAKLIFQETVSKPLAKGLGSLFGSIAGKLFQGGNGPAPVPSAPIPGYASGGMIPAGQLSIVGEKGPELFIPQASGTVISNNALKTGGLSSGPVINVTQIINISTGVQQQVRAEVASMMPAIEKRTRDGVMNAINRGGSAASVVGRKG